MLLVGYIHTPEQKINLLIFILQKQLGFVVNHRDFFLRLELFKLDELLVFQLLLLQQQLFLLHLDDRVLSLLLGLLADMRRRVEAETGPVR